MGDKCTYIFFGSKYVYVSSNLADGNFVKGVFLAYLLFGSWGVCLGGCIGRRTCSFDILEEEINVA
jgi:hypothetical protein